MTPEPAKFLVDMLDAAETVHRRCNGLTEDSFLADTNTRDAVCWNFVVIGEAMSQLTRRYPE